VAKDWLTTIGAGVCAVGLTVTSAIAGPSGMAVALRSPLTVSAPVSGASQRSMPVARVASRPSSEISPWRNPVKYLAATVSEIPQVWKSDKSDSNEPSPRPKDAISLDTPTGPPTPQLVISLAQVAERQGDIFQARNQYQQALAKWPGHVDVLRAAARMEDRQGELRLAETLYRQAVSANPQHAGALNDLGLCLARQGQLDASMQVIEQAIALQPQKALYRNNAATILVEMRQDERALAHLSAVHAPAEANFNLGQLLVQRGRPGDAAAYFQAALQINPELQAAQIALGQLQGTNAFVPGAWDAPASPEFTPDTTMPSAGPMILPQQPQAGPQLEYPGTAQSPEFGATSYRPQMNGARVGALPVYRQQAVPNQPAAMRR
jgi:tetratricopeptide (TPR) repeat protein